MEDNIEKYFLSNSKWFPFNFVVSILTAKITSLVLNRLLVKIKCLNQQNFISSDSRIIDDNVKKCCLYNWKLFLFIFRYMNANREDRSSVLNGFLVKIKCWNQKNFVSPDSRIIEDIVKKYCLSISKWRSIHLRCSHANCEDKKLGAESIPWAHIAVNV